MNRTLKEVIFDGLVITAAGLAFVTYMLGVFLDPGPAIVVGLALVGIGLATVVPREKLGVTAVSGVLAVLLAGVVVPRAVEAVTVVSGQLTLSLLISGVILLLTVAILHMTTFGRQPGQIA